VKHSVRTKCRVVWRTCVARCSVRLYALVPVLFLVLTLAVLVWLGLRDALDSALVPVLAALCGIFVGFLLTTSWDRYRTAERARTAASTVRAELDYILSGLRSLVKHAVDKDIDKLGDAERVELEITDIALNISTTIYHAYLSDLQGVREEIAMAVHCAYKLCDAFPSLVSLGMQIEVPQNLQPGEQRKSPTVSLPGSKIKHIAEGIEHALGLLKNEYD